MNNGALIARQPVSLYFYDCISALYYYAQNVIGDLCVVWRKIDGASWALRTGPSEFLIGLHYRCPHGSVIWRVM